MLPRFEDMFKARRRPGALACQVVTGGLRLGRMLGAAAQRTAKLVEGVAEAMVCISRALEAARGMRF